MEKCNNCARTILFGAVKSNEKCYCNEKCQEEGKFKDLKNGIPIESVMQKVNLLHLGACQKCRAVGSNDIHVAHVVWSLIYMTSWQSRPVISCRRCGVKRQAGAIAFCITLGWWGLPLGIFVTPFQIWRNIRDIRNPPNPNEPSQLLVEHVKTSMARELWEAKGSAA